jgi:L-lactate dehydrogenase (cytochrome)
MGRDPIVVVAGDRGVDCSEPIHAPGILEETLPPEKCLGPVDPATVERVEEEEEGTPKDTQGIPPIHQVINIDDFAVFNDSAKQD